MKKFLILFALLSPTVLAQNTSSSSNPAASSPLSSVFDQISQQAAGDKPTPAVSNKPVSDKLLSFKPSSKVSADIRNTFINGFIAQGQRNGTLTPALEKQVRDGFGKVDIAAEYQKLLGPKGFDVYNVVTAMTLYVVSAFQILDDLETTDATDRAIYEQFKKAFGGVPAVAKMSDADKQNFAEALMWLTAFQANDLEQAKKGTNGYTLENVKESVSSSLKGFKIDPERIQVGEKGLEARK